MPTKERDAGERERCVTGIDAIDHILNGGIPRGNTVLISGSVGTGKTSVCYRIKDQERIRDFLLRLGTVLSAKGCTSLLVSEIRSSEEGYSHWGVEEALADGVIVTGNLERRGDLLRTLQIVKMRGTTHSRAKYVLDLTTSGVLLVPLLKGGSGTGGG